MASNKGDVTVLPCSNNSKPFIFQAITTSEARKIGSQSIGIEDLTATGNIASVACRAGVVKLFKLKREKAEEINSFDAVGVNCATLSKRAENICLNGAGMGTRVIDINYNKILFENQHYNQVKSHFGPENNIILIAKQSKPQL